MSQRDPMWDAISPHKILDTKEQEAQWWERQREEQMRERMQLRPRLDPGNFAASPWSREEAPPLHRRSQMPPSDPFGMRWIAESLAGSILARPCDPKLKGRAERIPCQMDPSYSPLVTAWIKMEIESYCAKRGRPVQLIDRDNPPPPTPGELLAEAMKLLPALPPTAGGLCLPAKA